VSQTEAQRDRERALRAIDGEPAAIEWLADTLGMIPSVLAARNRRSNGFFGPQDLDDLAQEIATAIWRRLASFRGEARLSTWVYQICQVEFSGAIRRVARRPKPRPIDDVDEPGELAAEPDFLRHADLYDCLQRQTPEARELLLEKHFDGKSLETMAVDRATNLNTIKSRYTRALQRVRECLSRKKESPRD